MSALSTKWLQVKTWLQIAWVWIKRWWSVFAFGVVSVAALVLLSNRSNMINDLIKRQEETSIKHRQEISELQRIRDEEIRKREQVEARYRETMTRIDAEHRSAVERLTKDKQVEVKRIIEETLDDPDAMASRINGFFGIPIYSQPTTTTGDEKNPPATNLP